MAREWISRGSAVVMLLVAMLGVVASATPLPDVGVSVDRLQGRPFDINLNCRGPVPSDAQVVRLDPPEGGWPAWSQSVLVLDTTPGLVTLRRGNEARCGLSSDTRSSDTRFRSGVGATLAPAEGSREPIIVTAPARATFGWPMTVRYGDPAPVQREDTLRFAIRVGGIGILLAMLMSSILIAATARDRVAALFALSTAAFSLWIALRSGFAAWPRPWLPTVEWTRWALEGLPAVVIGCTWYVAVVYARCERVLPQVHRTRHWAFAAAGLLAVWMLSPLPGPTVNDLWRPLTVLALAAAGVIGAMAWHRGQGSGMALVVAVVPPLLVYLPLWGRDLQAWSSESVLISQAWYAVTMTIAMSLRMGALRRQRDRLKVLAERDPLTSLPNRRAMAATLPRRIDEAKAQGRSIAVIFVDIDRFKSINDSQGHDVGDEVLIEVARRLASMLRGGDLASRHGGEEFVLMLPGASAAQAMGLGERLRCAIADASVQTRQGPLPVTASFGVGVLQPDDPGGTAGAAALIARADAAMYRAKQAGRNRVEGPAAA